jgi:hypothetical protein
MLLGVTLLLVITATPAIDFKFPVVQINVATIKFVTPHQNLVPFKQQSYTVNSLLKKVAYNYL